MYRSNYSVVLFVDAVFMVAATILALATGNPLLAAMFGAKALLVMIGAFSRHRREKRLRRQLLEHLYDVDVTVRMKR